MPVLKIKNNGVWEQVGGIPDHTHVIDDITDFPTALPNPNQLTFTGATEGTYDGSSTFTVDIPDKLPTPNALTIKVGDTTVTYDGSEAKTVEIADGSEVAY